MCTPSNTVKEIWALSLDCHCAISDQKVHEAASRISERVTLPSTGCAECALTCHFPGNVSEGGGDPCVNKGCVRELTQHSWAARPHIWFQSPLVDFSDEISLFQTTQLASCAVSCFFNFFVILFMLFYFFNHNWLIDPLLFSWFATQHKFQPVFKKKSNIYWKNKQKSCLLC